MGGKQLDVTDVTAADVAFVSDSANDVTDFYAIVTAHFDAVQLHFANVTTFATRTVAVTAITAVATVATITATIVTVVELAS